MEKILVIDTETSGLDIGALILEIAIVEVSKNLTMKTVYNEVVGYNEEQLKACNISKEKLSFAWIFDHSDLKPEMIFNAKKNIIKITGEVQDLVKDQYVTCFWHQFDFYKFLDRDPWNLNQYYKAKSKDIMEGAKDPCGLWEEWRQDNKNPSLEQAYKILCKGKNSQKHRALDDALMAAEVLLYLLRNNLY